MSQDKKTHPVCDALREKTPQHQSDDFRGGTCEWARANGAPLNTLMF